MPRHTIAFNGDTPTRDRIASSIDAGHLLVFEECDLSGADLSRLDLQDSVFRNCVLLGTSLYAAKLARTRWQRCRAGRADFESSDLFNDYGKENVIADTTQWIRRHLPAPGAMGAGAGFT